MIVGQAKDLMGLLPKSALMFSHRPPLWRSKRDMSSCRAPLFRSCLRPDIVRQLPAILICPLLKLKIKMIYKRHKQTTMAVA
jgi:hypothetical protein